MPFAPAWAVTTFDPAPLQADVAALDVRLDAQENPPGSLPHVVIGSASSPTAPDIESAYLSYSGIGTGRPDLISSGALFFNDSSPALWIYLAGSFQVVP